MQYSTNVKGLITDINDSQKTEDVYSFVLNGTVENFSENQPFPFIGNTPSNIKCLQFLDEEQIVGILNINELDSTLLAVYNKETNSTKFVKLFYKNKDLLKSSSLVNNDCGSFVVEDTKTLKITCNSQVILESNCFNWNTTNILNLEYKLTDCSINLYFTNGVDEDRLVYFNLDWSLSDDFKKTTSEDNCITEYLNELDCAKTLWNPEIKYPCISLSTVSGGEKLNGKYNYLFAYTTSKGIPLTSFQSLTQGVSLFSLRNENSNKGIKVTIENKALNTRFQYYTIVAVESVKGITTYFQKGTYPISQNVVLDMDNKGFPISLQELVFKYPYYKSSKYLTTSNNILFKAGLEEYEKYNLQPVINKVKLNWVTKVLKEGDYKDKVNYTSYMRDEVYSFAIQPIVSNGEQLPAYPLIGRLPTIDDLSEVNNDDVVLKDCDTTVKKNWEVYNTASITYKNSKPLEELYKSCIDTDEVYEKGEFAYWESTELYPNIPEIWKENCSQPIRHFKFPDHITTTHHSSNGFEEKNYIFPIGVSVETDMNSIFDEAVTEGLITQEQRDRIIGWKLLRGNRVGNKTITAKGILYDVWKYSRDSRDENFRESCEINNTDYYFPNFPFNDLNTNKLLADKSEFYYDDNEVPNLLEFENTGKYTFHSPDTHFIEPDLGTTLKLEAVLEGESRGFFNIAEEQALYKLLNWKHFNLAISMAKWIASKQESPGKEAVQQTFENIGQSTIGTVGAAVGVAAGGGAAGASAGSAIGSTLGSLLGGIIGGAIYNSSTGLQFIDTIWRGSIVNSETEKFLSLIANLMEFEQYHYQYQAVGKYNKIKPYTDLGNKIRQAVSDYLGSGKYVIDNNFINNQDRESSVFIQTDVLPTIKDGNGVLVDDSRVLISENTDLDVSYTEEIEEVVSCKTYTITRTSNSKTKLSVWGKRCTPLLYDNNPTGQPITKQFYRNFNTGTNIVQGSSIDNVIIEVKPDGNFYVVEELVYLISSQCAFFCEKGDDNYNVFAPFFSNNSCYQDMKTREYKGDANDELDPTIIGEGNLKIEQVDICEDVVNKYTVTIRKGCECNSPTETNIASYYGSLKTENKNQYGSIYDIRWMSTGSCLNTNNECIFGGDTYINRFSFKRKHSLFNNTTFQLPNNTDINYSLLGNAAYPVYYFDTLPKKQKTYVPLLQGLNFPITGISDLTINKLFPIWGNYINRTENYINQPKYNFDCTIEEKTNEFGFNSAEGLMYLYYYGIPSFIVESEINVDLRSIGQNIDQDFYPNQSDLSFWLQEKNVSPKIDNYYGYDVSYSRQATDEFYYLNDINFRGQENCKTEQKNRIIYSNQDSILADDNLSDIYLVNKALDYYDFTYENGNVVSIDSIENDKVLVRQENNSSVFGAYIEINTSQNTALISSGSIFQKPPIQFTKPSLGYFGSQHQAILHTPFGHIFADAKRGYVFLLKNGGEGLEEISNKGMKHWFKENLPFTIGKYFDDVNIDSSFTGIGLTMCYDYRFNVMYLTKLDYKPLKDGITHLDNKFYFNGEEIFVTNKAYFCDKSWTISFNFYTQQWVSFHSFTPNFYIEHIDHFDSFKNNSLWKHNITNKSYQKYYGVLEPFIVETISKNEFQNNIVKSISFIVDVMMYLNEYDVVYKRNESFNKAIVYNKTQNSGLLNLIPETNDLSQVVKYPINRFNSTDILLNIKENYHSFNQFRDKVINMESLIWILNCNNAKNELNLSNIDYRNNLSELKLIRDFQNKVRLIQDKNDYHYIFKGLLIDNGTSKRI